MQRLSKFLFVLMFVVSLHTTYYLLLITDVMAQDAIPQIGLSCTQTRDNEFHSTRPYQAATCGEAPLARFCSNKLVIFEDFDVTDKCWNQREFRTGNWTCELEKHVDKHDLNITLDESEFPIMGNTEDEFDDATKLNEYASWYLSGVIDKKENTEPTDDQVVNFSGPVRKLLPAMIQDVQRIKTVNSYLKEVTVEDTDSGTSQEDRENHDQIVIGDERLSSWKEGDLSGLRNVTNTIGGIVDNITGGTLTNLNIGDAWNKRTPPLPWDDGTIDDDPNNPNVLKVPFKSQILYQKAYNEWLGKSCLILPIIGLQCIDNLLVPNKYAELWNFVPLSNNSDKRGKNYLLTGDGPNYVPSAGTSIKDAQHISYLNAPLYFAHTQEVKDLSDILNRTYKPEELTVENNNSVSVGFPDDVEVINKGTDVTPDGIEVPNPIGAPLSNPDPYNYLDCSAVNVRVNEGDNLFPGDRPGKPNDKELYVEGAEYTITEAECNETYEFVCDRYGPLNIPDCKWVSNLKCNAQVGIEFKLGTQTPWAKEIFNQTVAGVDSTFRKIFPKVEEGAPVECIADIPTTTGVKYSIDNSVNEKPQGGSQSLSKTKYPADGGGSGTELTFPHIGSVYEYFLNGIQTALRPKGYGSPIANGNCRPIGTIQCGKVPDTLPKPTGLCASGNISPRLGNLPQNLLDIVYAAAETYKVPPSLILGIMFGESRFNTNASGGYTTYDWTEENVDRWATCEEMPKCHSIPYVYNAAIAISEDNWGRIANGTSTQKGIKEEIKKIAPDRDVSGCNLLDSIYAIAWLLRDNVDGGPFQIKSCFGVTLNTGASTAKGCDWDNNDLITAIKVNESGWTNMCFTNKGSCATGGGRSAACSTGGDTCETISNRYPQSPSFQTSHMGCVFDVAKGN